MAQCHWHPERAALAQCDLCHRPMCSACSTQVAEPPDSYRLCPECLDSLEALVDRGLALKERNVSSSRAWLGAAAGGISALALWLVTIYLISPEWKSFVRWVSYVNTGLMSALFAVKFTGDRRGPRVAIPTTVVTVLVILVGHFFSAMIQFHAYLVHNPQAMHTLVSKGILSQHPGWWLPWDISFPTALELLGWRDVAVIAGSLYVVYAFTRRGRLWQAHRNRPFAPRSGGDATQ